MPGNPQATLLLLLFADRLPLNMEVLLTQPAHPFNLDEAYDGKFHALIRLCPMFPPHRLSNLLGIPICIPSTSTPIFRGGSDGIRHACRKCGILCFDSPTSGEDQRGPTNSSQDQAAPQINLLRPQSPNGLIVLSPRGPGLALEDPASNSGFSHQ